MMRVHSTMMESFMKKAGAALSGQMLPIPDSAGARATWDKLDPEYSARLIARGDELLTKPWPGMLMSMYTLFAETGDRARFEEKYFGRRRMLTQLVMAECAEGRGRYLKKIIDGVYLILSETTWCLPAHNSYIRDKRQLMIPDVSRPVVDLFAAETGAILALTVQLLRLSFKEVSPYIETAVDNALYERIFEPYLNYHFWWMGNGQEPMCNWTTWITQNVLLAAFCRPEEESLGSLMVYQKNLVDSWEDAGDSEGSGDTQDWPSRHLLLSRRQRELLLSQAAMSIDYFLDEYAEDGCCDEGAQYYGHAGLTLFGCLEILFQLSGHHPDIQNRLSQIFRLDKIRNIAEYIAKVYVGDGQYINFADCSPRAGSRGAREFLFGLRTESALLMGFAARDHAETPDDEKLMPKEENLWYHMLQAMFHKEMMACSSKAGKTEMLRTDAWYPSTGLMIARNRDLVLAVKAGDNGDSHNHNDVGSFILYCRKQPVFIDLGVGTYTKKTFSPDRYDIFTMQSKYHNLPTFEDVQQKPGEKYRAEGVQCLLADSCAEISMDIARAYGDKRIESYKRRVTLVKDRALIIEDSYKGELPCTLSLLTYEKPEIHGRKLRIGELAEFEMRGVNSAAVEQVRIDDARLGETWKHDCYRLVLGIGHDFQLLLELEEKDQAPEIMMVKTDEDGESTAARNTEGAGDADTASVPDDAGMQKTAETEKQSVKAGNESQDSVSTASVVETDAGNRLEVRRILVSSTEKTAGSVGDASQRSRSFTMRTMLLTDCPHTISDGYPAVQTNPRSIPYGQHIYINGFEHTAYDFGVQIPEDTIGMIAPPGETISVCLDMSARNRKKHQDQAKA